MWNLGRHIHWQGGQGRGRANDAVCGALKCGFSVPIMAAYFLLEIHFGAGEVTQQLRAHCTLAQDLRSVPTSQVWWLKLPVTPATGMPCPFWSLGHLHFCNTDTHNIIKHTPNHPVKMSHTHHVQPCGITYVHCVGLLPLIGTSLFSSPLTVLLSFLPVRHAGSPVVWASFRLTE